MGIFKESPTFSVTFAETEFVDRSDSVCVNHRLNMELDLQSLFGLHVT
jgi:hypothetical protein